MKRGGMRNAPQIDMKKVSDDAAAAATASNRSPVPAINKLREVLGHNHGETMTAEVLGRSVTFTLQVIAPERIERKTMVWGQNERLQELLTESALDDLLPTFSKDGQQFPAFGRETSGIIEVADGSRRRMAAILTKREYRIWVGELDDEQMASLSEIGNDYRPTSAYERGKRYKRLVEQVYGGNVKAMADCENIARRVVIRCMATADLPVEIIKLFANPTELSARAGEELQRVYKDHSQAMMERVSELEMFKISERLDADFIVKTLKAAKPAAEKATQSVRTFGAGVTAKYKGDDVEISLKGASPALIKRIEALLEMESAEKGGVENSEVDALFEKLEKHARKA